MNDQELKLIDGMFAQLRKAAAESEQQDAAAVQRITQQMQAFPQAPYFMVQLIILQRAALKRAQQLAKAGSEGAQSPAAPPPQQSRPRSQQEGAGFLAGAAQTALGVAGGIVVADLAIGAIDELAYGDVYDDMALEGAYETGAGDMAATTDLEGGDDDWGGGDDFGGWGGDDF